MSLVLLARLNLDGGAQRFAQVGISSTTAYWEKRVLAFGENFREVPLNPESPRQASARIILANQDGYFSDLRATENFANRTLDIILADSERGEGQFVTIFSGIMEPPVITDEICEVYARDAIGVRFVETIPFIINNLGFPWLPDRTPRNFVPIVMGTISAPTGALPAYPIDEAIGTAAPKFRYLAAQHVLKSVTEVFVYGVQQASGWTVNYVPGQDGVTLTVIDFDSNPFDAAQGSESEVTYNAIGMTDDGTSGGTAITNPALQLEQILLRAGFKAAEIDDTLRDSAADEYTQLNVQGAVAITEPSSLATVLDRFARSFGLLVFQSRNAKVGMTAPTVQSLTSTPVLSISDKFDIERNGFELRGVDRLATKITAKLKPNFVTGEFLESQLQDDPTESGAQARVVPDDAEMWYVRDPVRAADLLNSFLFYRREQRHVVELTVRENLYGQLEVGNVIRVSHFAGPSEDGSGFVDRPFRIIGIGLSERMGLLATRLRLIDLKDVDPHAFGSDHFIEPNVIADTKHPGSYVSIHAETIRL